MDLDERNIRGRSGVSNNARRAADSPPPHPVPLPALSAADRLLVLAPHEDDEVLAAGGLIQQAVSVGAAVRVLYLTYGDHNLVAFLLQRRRPWLSFGTIRRLGERRRAESIEAMALLGVPENRLIFLGYPDHCILRVWRRHWGRMPPYYSPLSHAWRVPYASSPAHGHPYTAEAILSDLEQTLDEFQPTRVVVSHPRDGHPDHRALYQMLDAVRMRRAAGNQPFPAVLAYAMHESSWPMPKPYGPHHAGDGLGAWDPHAPWWTHRLTPEERARKEQAILCFTMQLRNKRTWLLSFAGHDEIFVTPSPLTLADMPRPFQRRLTQAPPYAPADGHRFP